LGSLNETWNSLAISQQTSGTFRHLSQSSQEKHIQKHQNSFRSNFWRVDWTISIWRTRCPSSKTFFNVQILHKMQALWVGCPHAIHSLSQCTLENGLCDIIWLCLTL
jgi:hypothetical protein